MAVKPLVTVPNPMLNREVKDVVTFDESLKALISDLEDTMYENDGVGIAAPQIGVDLKVAIVDMEQEGILQLINPTIVSQSEEIEADVEGCLSVPGVFGEVNRSKMIVVSSNDLNGNEVELTAYDDVARIILHEVDHLYGELFTDKMTREISEDELEEMYKDE
ncbi:MULTISPECIES: peptide deformylase [Mammaliicoccus]|uniref:Peptide deformylase n=1 Tax=Mammaliicoccus vitulinus TaxID=71237 RepID=A0A2T4PRS1_9STAP|nr:MULTISPECIES: peptide deformylase [Mammaliicoccus]HAL08889.1 peptide deformylase [Staphylococcus sp.]MBM6628708.1 peptide deformylase [Mammaliicoccus vitulinus]MBO3076815.1 peptide deformylase [Mammaliicoccus vitulinus]MEB7656488.1 peptide deformylase [Mammaliicoccus vitulinus]PNZ35119.1 peptide deformylase [Mammaliicoccus vitulinus]